MKWVFTDVRTRLYLISAIVLVVGVSSAIVIYRNAVTAQSEVLGYEVGNDGTVYPIMPGDSKTYQRSLEVYGGKANVITDRFRRWLVGLWRGKSLAYTVGFISILASITLFSIARNLPGGPDNRNQT